MASIQTNYTQDQNWEGEIRVNYRYAQNQGANTSTVYIDSVEYRSNVNGGGWGRTAQWTVYGDILFSGHDYFTYSGERFNTYGSDWVTLGSGRSTQFTVYHDGNGYGSFDVVFQGVGSYNDFNVFHPDGGSYNCEITGGTTITADLPRIVPDATAPVIDLSVNVTDMGVASLVANADVSCGSWAYQVDGGSWTAISGTGTQKSVTLSGMKGTHSYRVKAVKVSNNQTGYSATVTKTTDTAAPTITLAVSATDLGVATMMGDANASCGSWAYQLDGGSWTAVSGMGTQKSVTVYDMTGTHTYRMKATKSSNGEVGYSPIVTKTTDTSAPTITLTASADSSGTVTLNASANASCTSWGYRIDGGSWNSVSGTASSKVFTVPGMTGSHTFQVRATKSSNNQTGTSDTVTTKTPTLSLSSTAVTTNGSMTLTVRYLPANTKVQIKYGDTVLSENSWSSYRDSVTGNYNSAALQALFEESGVTTQQSITLTALVNGYSYTAQSFTLSSGSNMNPTVGTPTATIVQGSTVDSSLANVYIAGFSKVKIAASVTAGSGSSISSVIVSSGSKTAAMSYNSSTGKYEATTSAPITGDTTFTVTATDARGLSGTGTVSVTGVKSWTEPNITFDTSKTYRCDNSGTKTDGGAYVRVKVTFSYTTGISGNGVRDLYFYIKEDGSSTTHNLTSGTQSAAYALGSPRPNETITVVVQGRDKVGGYVTRELQLAGAHRDFALANYQSSNAGRRVTAMGVGMAPDITTESLTYGDTIQMPADGRLTIGGKEAQNFLGCNTRREIGGEEPWGKDLLAYEPTNPMAEDNETAEFYIAHPNTSGWTNLPGTIASIATAFEGTRMVIFGYDSVFIMILEQAPVAGRIWINTKRKSSSSTSWSGWMGHTPDIT